MRLFFIAVLAAIATSFIVTAIAFFMVNVFCGDYVKTLLLCYVIVTIILFILCVIIERKG